jgi:hypothetical protein
MKRTLYLISCILIVSINAYSQPIPNNGFENWAMVGNYEMPDYWDNLNPTTDPAGIYTCTRGTPGNPGAAYLKLTSTLIPGTGVVPGVAVCGVLDQSRALPVSGFAFYERPEKFTGKWQYMMFGTGKGFMDVLLTKWNASAGKRDTVASMHHVLTGMVMTWGNFTIPLTYMSGSYPDSCIIFLSASGSVPADYDYLWLDNLAFTGSVFTDAPASEALHARIKIYPNPATDIINLWIHPDKQETAEILLFDGSGRLVKTVSRELTSGDNNSSILTHGFQPGIYIMNVRTSSFEETLKIMIQ